LDGIEVDP
jgi:hypothetical protein